MSDREVIITLNPDGSMSHDADEIDEAEAIAALSAYGHKLFGSRIGAALDDMLIIYARDPEWLSQAAQALLESDP